MKTLPFLLASATLHAGLGLAAALGAFEGASSKPVGERPVEMELVWIETAPKPLVEPPVREPEPLPVEPPKTMARRTPTPRTKTVAAVEAAPVQRKEEAPSELEAAPMEAPPAVETSEQGGMAIAVQGVEGGRGGVGGSLDGVPGGTAKAQPVVVTIDAGALLAQYLSELNPLVKRQYEYPRRARRAQLQGLVIVEAVVDRAGQIIRLGVHRSSGHEILDSAALETIRSLGKFPPLPAALGTKPQAVRIPLEYQLS